MTDKPTPRCTTSSKPDCPTTQQPAPTTTRTWPRDEPIKAVFRAHSSTIARETFNALTGHITIPDYSDLRPTRRAKNLTLTAAAEHLSVWPAHIEEPELGPRPNHNLTTRYQEWLTTA